MAEKLRHIISPDNFTRQELDEELLLEARRMEELGSFGSNLLLRKRLLGVFFAPSFITKTSFLEAMGLLGGQCYILDSAQTTTWDTGLTDEIRFLNRRGFYHGLVLRSDKIGGAALAASVSHRIPVINAGEGRQITNHSNRLSQHPTQFLGDLKTLQDHFGHISGLSILVAGDVQWDRVNSLATGLSLYEGVNLHFVSAPGLPIDIKLERLLEDKAVKYQVSHVWTPDLMRNVDVVYVTRQRPAGNLYYVNGVKIDPEALSLLPKDSIVMHPMERGEELPTEVDSDPRVVWLRQAENGTFTRMALLKMLLS